MTGMAPDWRRIVSLLVFFAFAVQSTLVQTHLHNLPRSVVGMSQVVPAVHTDDGKAAPDEDNCLLCQEYLHAGIFLAPAAAAVLPPVAAISLIRLTAPAPAVAASPSHIWTSRAPPRA